MDRAGRPQLTAEEKRNRQPITGFLKPTTVQLLDAEARRLSVSRANLIYRIIEAHKDEIKEWTLP